MQNQNKFVAQELLDLHKFLSENIIKLKTNTTRLMVYG
jgi:hypothetical protein